MSLQTDSIFIAAIGADADIMETIDGRLYGTAIPLPDEDADNVPVPYLIVTFDSLQNSAETKDTPFEGDEDIVNIGIEVAATTLASLHALTQKVRNVVREYFESGNASGIDDYRFTADAIRYDSLKPCFWQVLRYQCSTDLNVLDYEQD